MADRSISLGTNTAEIPMKHARNIKSLQLKSKGTESKIATNAAWVDGETLGYHCARFERLGCPAAAQKLDISQWTGDTESALGDRSQTRGSRPPAL
jgi:hypothetical protein